MPASEPLPGDPLAQPLAEVAVTAPASPQGLDALHAALERLWALVEASLPQRLDATWRAQFATAVGEIGANIARHAHPPGTPPGVTALRLRAYPDRVEAHFEDRGLPLETCGPEQAAAQNAATGAGAGNAPPDVPDVPDVPESGYGLALVRAAVDLLEYRRTAGGTNRWRLAKHLRPSRRGHRSGPLLPRSRPEP